MTSAMASSVHKPLQPCALKTANKREAYKGSQMTVLEKSQKNLSQKGLCCPLKNNNRFVSSCSSVSNISPQVLIVNIYKIPQASFMEQGFVFGERPLWS